MSRWLGVTLGDPSGIGPEVALKALKALPATDDFKYLLLGDAKLINRLNESIGLPLQQFQSPTAERRFFFLHIGPQLPTPLP